MIERAVWSFWTAPYESFFHRRWASERFHRLSWALSVLTARRHFVSTALVTDDSGARLLVDDLGLPFDDVSTSLGRIRHADPRWWILGKLVAYREQQAPFLHIDGDVYLFKALPERLMSADLVAQNPEFAPTTDDTYYKPTAFTRRVEKLGGTLPPEWHAYVRAGGATGMCLGVFGGTDLAFIHRYATRAIETIQHPANRSAWCHGGVELVDNVLMEQYYVAAAWADLGGPPDRRPVWEHCFGSQAEAFASASSRRLGYTHLIAAAKMNSTLENLVARRLEHDFPEHYERIEGVRRAAVRSVA